MDAMRAGGVTVGLVAALLIAAPLAQRRDPPRIPATCDRGCLESLVNQYLDANYPLAPSFGFWIDAVRMASEALLPLMIWTAWPLLTLATLMIFRVSMHRARVKTAHVLRCVIYSGDVIVWGNLLLTISVSALALWWLRVGGINLARLEWLIWAWLGLTLLLPLVFWYRLTIAYRKYLRFDHPIATVFASQVIVALFVFIALTILATNGL